MIIILIIMILNLIQVSGTKAIQAYWGHYEIKRLCKAIN